MDPKHRKLISDFEEKLKVVNFSVIKQNLEKSKIFTKDMLEDLYSGKTNLIEELPTRGPGAFAKFIDVLKSSSYNEIADLLEDNSKIPLANSESKSKVKADFTSYTGDYVKPSHHYYVENDAYKILSVPRGYVLVINNIDFLDLMKKRVGSEIDAKNIERIFSKIGFSVEIKDNLNYLALKEVLKNFAKKDFLNVDSCVLFILSHGNRIKYRDAIYSVDKEAMYVDDILKMFNNDNCDKSLIGKPKMIFIQACRGNDPDYGVDLNECYDSQKIEINNTFNKLPSCTDMLVVSSTLHDCISIRDKIQGTWFINALLSVIKENSHDTDLETILKKVNEIIIKKTGKEGEKQAIEVRSLGMSKKIYLNPQKSNENKRLLNNEFYS